LDSTGIENPCSQARSSRTLASPPTILAHSLAQQASLQAPLAHGSSRGAHSRAQEARRRRVHPHDRALAAEVGGAIDETLESLGLEAPPPAPPAPPPPAPALRPEDPVEIVVLAAVEHTGAAPAAERQWLHAVFKRAHEIGLSTDIAERALRPGTPPAQGTFVRSPRGGKLEA
jgi:hypothetical protein